MNEGRSGTAEPVTLVDLDGAETRIAPWGSWTHEQVRHPGGRLMFVTRLHRGQLWHRTAAPTAHWTHQVQVGPAMVVSPRGRFHAVAETDGGATVTCLEGMVEVSTGLRDALALQPDQAVAVAADGETCVVTEALEADRPLLVEPAEQPPLPPSGPATTAARPGRRRLAAALVVLALVALVIVVALVARRGSDRSPSSVTTPDRRATSVPRSGVSTTLPPATGAVSTGRRASTR